MATFFCPNCWHTINHDTARCQECGYEIHKDNQRSYEKKLIAALDHPVQENRILAAQVLGDLHSTRSLRYFRKILTNNQSDYYFSHAILEALKKIPHPKSHTIMREALHNGIPLIVREAREFLRKSDNEQREILK